MRRETRCLVAATLLVGLLACLATGCPKPEVPEPEPQGDVAGTLVKPQPPSTSPEPAGGTSGPSGEVVPEAREPSPGEAESDDPAADQSPPTVPSDPPADEPPATDRPESGSPGTSPAEDAAASKGADQNLFEGWAKPEIALLLSGQQHGYIEPCGCTGLENQKGGLARRHTLVKQLRERDWNVVPLDVGNQVRRFGRQAEIKFQMTVEGLSTMKYQAVTLGPDDLQLSIGDLVAATTDAGDQVSPFVSANASILDLTPSHRVLEVSGKRIGVAGVLGDSFLEKVAGDEITTQNASDGLNQAWEALQQADCDYYILLAHATLDETRDLVRQQPGFHLAVSAGGAGEPRLIPEVVEGTETPLVEVGTKGMYAGVVGIYPDQPAKLGQGLRYQRIPLDDRFEDSPAMLDLLAAYQQQLKQAGLEGLGLRPLPHPRGTRFVGSQKCAECHDGEYEVWAESGHAHATDSIVRPPNSRGDIARHHDPECISCHVTGWNPQQYFPYESGYLKLSAEDHFLHGSGCENCHGPGSAHVRAEEDGADDSLVQQLREQMRLPLERAEAKCIECHDLDNSPDFEFSSYWDEIAH